MLRGDYLVSRIKVLLVAIGLFITFEGFFIAFMLLNNVDSKVYLLPIYSVIVTGAVLAFLGGVLPKTLFSMLYNLTHLERYCYIPVTEMEIESLNLDTVEDYLYTVATITNSQASNKNNLFSFLGTQGVDLSGKDNEVGYIVRNHYGYSGGYNITEHLHFINTKEQVNNLCAQDLYKTEEQD